MEKKGYIDKRQPEADGWNFEMEAFFLDYKKAEKTAKRAPPK